jgi:hypothetical protein
MPQGGVELGLLDAVAFLPKGFPMLMMMVSKMSG